jgi:hypothetical protein
MKRTLSLAVSALAPLALAGGAALSSADAASAAASPDGQSTGIIFGGCSPLEDGEYTIIRGQLAECIHLPFGWYWVEVTENVCPGVSPASLGSLYARNPATLRC